MKKAAERAAALTHQLLAYSGGGQFNMQTVQLNDLIQENIHLFEVALPPSVRLETNLDPHLPPIEADAGQMQQVLMNLIINGAEAIQNDDGCCGTQFGNRSATDRRDIEQSGRRSIQSFCALYEQNAIRRPQK